MKRTQQAQVGSLALVLVPLGLAASCPPSHRCRQTRKQWRGVGQCLCSTYPLHLDTRTILDKKTRFSHLDTNVALPHNYSPLTVGM